MDNVLNATAPHQGNGKGNKKGKPKGQMIEEIKTHKPPSMQ
jgi:hypothetical protein